MSKIAQPLFSWPEPRAYRRTRRIVTTKRLRTTLVVAFIIFLVGMGMITWGFLNGGERDPQQRARMTIGMMLATSTMFALLPWIQECIPFRIVVTEWDLQRKYGLLLPFGFRWIQALTYSVRDYDQFRVLVFDLKDKRRLLFGLPIEFNLQDLESFFIRQGLQKRLSS